MHTQNPFLAASVGASPPYALQVTIPGAATVMQAAPEAPPPSMLQLPGLKARRSFTCFLY